MTTALITGATAGIGHEFAVQLAAKGYDLVLVARDRERLAQVAAELERTYGIETATLAADPNDPGQLAGVEERVASTTAPIDLLINNAGFGLKGRFLDNSVDQETAMFDILTRVVLRLSHAALTAMDERGSGGIINVSSVAGFLPRGTYSAAKAWVNSFSDWAHWEYKSNGVQVMALCPGFTKTEFHGRMNVGRDSVPKFMWLDVDFLVREAIKDFEAGKVYSVPGLLYQAIVALSKVIPNGLLQRAQSMGRK